MLAVLARRLSILPEGCKVLLVAMLGFPLEALRWLPTNDAVTGSAAIRGVTITVAMIVTVRAARQSEPDLARARWWWVAALAAAATGSVISAVETAAVGHLPVPSVADPVMLSWFAFAACGFYCLPRRRGGRVGRPRLLLDGVITASALLFLVWLFVMEPVLRQHWASASAAGVELAYPVGDIFIAALIVAVLPSARADVSRILTRVAFGILLIAAMDAVSTRVWLGNTGVGFGWTDVGTEAGLLLVVLGAAAPAGTAQPPIWWRIDLPTLAASTTILIGLPYVAAGHLLAVDDVVPAAVMIAGLLMRQRLYARELRAAAESHERAAMLDELTGLASRRAFLAALSEHVGTPGTAALTVVLIDLNGFKEVNDRFGHQTGDEVLVQFSQVLRSAAAGHVIGRLGGDEFAVALSGKDSLSMAERLTATLSSVHHLPVPCTGQLALTCSAGVAQTRPQDTRTADVMRRADLAMYAAKHRPAHRVVVFEQHLEDESSRRHLLVAALSGAAERGELQLVYQPVYRLLDDTLTAAEALVRWTSPRFGMVPPSEFIPVAEETGQILAIGRWVLEAGIAAVDRWQRAGCYLPRLLVNVSAKQLSDHDFVELVESLTDRHGIPPQRLTIEITESQLTDLPATKALNALHDLGVRLALDDFGTGYSNLARLARLPMDILKVDREFIADLDRPGGCDVLRSVVGLAQTLHMTTVAEGIETQSQRASAAACGITWGQGYLLGRPMSEDQLRARLPLLGQSSARSLPRRRPAPLSERPTGPAPTPALSRIANG